MLFKSSLLIAANLVGAGAFAPSQIAKPSTIRQTAIASEESNTALFKKRSSSKKKGAGKASSKGFAGALRDLQMNAFPYAGTIRPGVQSPQKVVLDESIMKPDYALDGVVSFKYYLALSDNYCSILYFH